MKHPMKLCLKFLSFRIKILFILLVVCCFTGLSFAIPVKESGGIDSLSRVIRTGRMDTATIRLHIMLSKAFYVTKNFDSTIAHLDKAHDLTRKLNYDHWLYEIYKEYGYVLNTSGNFSLALDYYFRMLKILDERTRTNNGDLAVEKNYADLYLLIGTSYFKMESFDKALEYYSTCLKTCRDIYLSDPTYPLNERLLVLYNNIGSVYLTTGSLDSAKSNFERSIEINKKINNQAIYATLYNNIGIICKTRKQYDDAFNYYNKSLTIRLNLKDTAGIAQVYNNLGDCYYLVNNFPESIKVLTKALELSRLSNNLTSQLKAANFLTLAYEKAGDFRKSLELQRLYNKLFDSINNSDQVRLSAKLELQYMFEKKQKENELLQQIQLADKQRKVLVFMIISGVLFFSFVILFLLNRNQMIKLKRNELLHESLLLESKNLNLEKQNLLLEKQNLELQLDFRNKELATHVMYLLRKNEFIASISKKLLDFNSVSGAKNNAWLKEIVREMNSNIDNTVWNEFEVRFQQVHQDFYQKLGERFPDLSPNERKLCAFMRLNMTTKDICAITFQSINSIRVARIRLRKKMGMARDENLVAFLHEL